MNRIFPKLVLALTLVVAAVSANAQITARQGQASDADVAAQDRFHSPMVLDFPFNGVDPLLWGKTYTLKEDTRRYICDGVAVTGLRFQLSKERKGVVKVTINGFVVTERGMDKLVSVLFELRNGSKTIASSGWSRLDAEEGKTVTPSPAVLLVSTASLKRDPMTMLHMVVKAEDNP